MLKKLYLLVIAILVLAVLVTGLVSIQVINSFNDRYNRNILLSSARMIEQSLDNGLTTQQASEQAVDAFGQYEASIRVTIVAANGTVLYDNFADPNEMGNHLYRPEIKAAFSSKNTGSTIRTSSTLNQQMLYIAVYSENQDIVIRTAISLTAYYSGRNNILLLILIVMASSLILLALGGTWLTRKITRPLTELQDAALAMANGQYDVRVQNLYLEKDEVAQLSRAFNTMASELEQTVLDLNDKKNRLDVILNSMNDPLLVVNADTTVSFINRAASETFERDLNPDNAVFPLYLVTHRQETDEQVQKAINQNKAVTLECDIHTAFGRKTFYIMASPIQSVDTAAAILTFHDVSELRKLQQMRTDFVANVTHELRTPLTSIRGFIETLRQGAIEKPEVAERFLDIIDVEAERLHNLISDVLILSEIEDLREDKGLESFDLGILIDDAIVLLDEAASARRISLAADIPEDPIMVRANPDRIKQILINLVGNAIKYNYDEGRVEIRASRQPDGKLQIKVSDNGPGIPVDQQDRIFERFYRVDSSRSRELGGTGLGLSIVKHIAQLYNGTASVESQPGQGAIFTVDLEI